MISPGSVASLSRSINYYGDTLYTVSSLNTFILNNGGNIPLFSPDSGTYLIGAWVKEQTGCGVTGYKDDSIMVELNGSSPVTYVFYPSGPVIEGWQRFEGQFTIPGSATSIRVQLFAGANTTYYDDIRMHPFSARMNTYVYDPISTRVMAILDENNYATFFEYNDEGIEMRVKKETEKGIKTIKENRTSYLRN